MMTAWQEFDVRVTEWIQGTPGRIPLITGGCWSGRTALLARVGARLGPGACQVADVSRITATPERFLASLVEASPFDIGPSNGSGTGPADAFARALSFLTTLPAPDRPATFLLDEILDLRVFESFPGLRSIVPDTFKRLVDSENHFVLTTRFSSRALRVARELPGRLLVQAVPALDAGDVAPGLADARGISASAAEELARTVIALTGGRYGYVQELTDGLTRDAASVPDPVSVLARQIAPGGALASRCAFSYELRLNRTRGYGTLRAILGILAEEEPLTLTEIAHLMQRTPGSTKDYLTWLEEVDLIEMHHKRYAFTDPVLRLWVRLNQGPVPPGEGQVVADVQRYALGRLS